MSDAPHAYEPHTHDHAHGPHAEGAGVPGWRAAHSHSRAASRGHSHGREQAAGRAHLQGDDPEPSHHSHAPGDHGHGDHGHDHDHGSGWWSNLRHQVSHFVTPHSHEAMDKVDSVMETSREGMRALWLSLGILGLTTVIQVVIVAVSGSVALLGDTIHNAADALTAIPLGIAFVLGRRAATRRYTYGNGRAEDLAGIAIVLTIAASSALAAYEAVDRLLNPSDVTHLGAVAIAAVVGFTGNEWVARYRITTGRKIGSAALVADGLHARTDGFTSLAVLFGAGGVAIGWRWADPVIGLLITAAIVMVLKDAAREVYRRLMDSVDPKLVDAAETALRSVDGVHGVGQVRMRWIGHALRAETDIVVDPHLTVEAAHTIAAEAEHALIHAVPRLTAATVHTDPRTDSDPHAALAHHADSR